MLRRGPSLITKIFLIAILSILFAPIKPAFSEVQKQDKQENISKSNEFEILAPWNIFRKKNLSDLKPKIKYSPETTEDIPYTSVPDWMGPWKTFKKQLEEEAGINVSVTLDDHYQFILNGPKEGHGRNIFWWNLTAKKKLWENAKLILKVRGSTTYRDPPNGITPLVGPKLNLDWAAYETELIYLANLYVEQKLLNNKLLVAIGKITFPSYFDENKVAGWDFFSHSLARNQIFIHKYHTIGALSRYDVTDSLYVQAGITDVQGIRSETGLNTAFHGADYFLSMFELGIKKKMQGLGGAGVDLAPAKKIVNFYGGKIRLESTINQSSTIYFYFPCHSSKEEVQK